MDDTYLYRQVAEAIRQDILQGKLKAGDRLPSLREMARRWKCTVGTVQRAYQELARQKLVVSRAGQGTRVAETSAVASSLPLRRAALAHRAEAFLLEVLSAGYTLEDVEIALLQAMERWRVIEREQPASEAGVLRFVGSHDLVVTWLASHFPEIASGHRLQLRFAGSLGGLIALAEGKADLAGSHLLDEESGEFNLPFVCRLLPGQRVALVTLAQRRHGLILAAGNPLGVGGLEDLTRPGLRFVNRQRGSGTRLWLDMALRRAGISAERINGYQDERMTHTAVAQAVAEGQADVGVGLEAAARSFGLDFIFLAHDRYDLVIPAATLAQAPVQALVNWLQAAQTRRMIEGLGGYDAHQTGKVTWVG